MGGYGGGLYNGIMYQGGNGDFRFPFYEEMWETAIYNPPGFDEKLGFTQGYKQPITGGGPAGGGGGGWGNPGGSGWQRTVWYYDDGTVYANFGLNYNFGGLGGDAVQRVSGSVIVAAGINNIYGSI
jgi:hypothetical protein